MHIEEFIQPSIRFLNITGDITISWDDEDKDAVKALVEEKMREGYSFFIVREAGTRGARPRVKAPDDLDRAAKNSLYVSNTVGADQIDDADLMIAMQNKVIRFAKVEKKEAAKQIPTVRRASNAGEVVVAETVAMKPIVAG